jgi:hypothetical protein
MATWSLSVNVGQSEFSIIEGTDVPATGDIEITVNVAKLPGNTGGAVAPNAAVLVALRQFENFIMGKSKIIY